MATQNTGNATNTTHVGSDDFIRRNVNQPSHRKLRVYAFDPLFSTRSAGVELNEAILAVPWEYDRATGKDILQPGPIGEYIEVIDYDPSSGCFYHPVDLDTTYLLAQDGLPPSEGNPQFHQQMVYAVAMTTIRNFEQALGRCVLWTKRKGIRNDPSGKKEFVRRLRIYPHALREANAYYSPAKVAVLFGYFPAPALNDAEIIPGGIVFTCLSHDIIAHEITHALLDGLHQRFVEPTNQDALAFHEAFADIVALFQHFSIPGVLEHQIRQTRGDLTKQHLLGDLAQQFGKAIGKRGALRSALGHHDDKTGEWVRAEPNPRALGETTEPHARGAILVAAVFDAFLSIYQQRIADLLRIATQGTGVLPQGQIHPDLVQRMAREASKTARHVVQMCIRALDYCPPVDVNFGDYLRALLTADIATVSSDPHNYRVAVIEAFRGWGIYPNNVRTLSVESLIWHGPTEIERKIFRFILPNQNALKQLVPKWGITTDREKVHHHVRRSAALLHSWMNSDTTWRKLQYYKDEIPLRLGFCLGPHGPHSIERRNDKAVFEVHSVRNAVRQSPDGELLTDIVVEILQRRRGFFDPEEQLKADTDPTFKADPDFWFRGGCTLLIDQETSEIRFIICKRILSAERLERQRKHELGRMGMLGLASTYGVSGLVKLGRQKRRHRPDGEPFAILHSGTQNTGGDPWPSA